ncbi:MAG: DUF177 domain-containing protein [Balneolaceae bacterium]
MQKLTFDIQEIPEGQTRKEVHLPEDYFALDDEIHLIDADVDISFLRTDHFVKVSFRVTSNVELICDRSLEPFIKNIESDFDIIFEPGEVEESESVKSAVRQIPADELVINIEDEVRDTILLNVPVKKIHPKFYNKDGEPEDFGTARFGKDDSEADDEQPIDPRWEELKKLK